MGDEWVLEAAGALPGFQNNHGQYNPPTWMVVSAIGTKLAYDRYFGPEETKKATDTPPPAAPARKRIDTPSQQRLAHLNYDIARGALDDRHQSIRPEYYTYHTFEPPA